MAVATAAAAEWPMQQGDAQHTGRAPFTVPEERLDERFFDILLWQVPAPGSPGEGNFGATQMVFKDGAGPLGRDIVIGAYHWPKGVQGMDRHDGRLEWWGNPSGGESIGDRVPAFSPDGATVYVTNDSTSSPEWPNGHPLMAFSPSVGGPSGYRHNGAMGDPDQLAMRSPVIAPDGRIFLHPWSGRPHAGVDDGAAIGAAWEAGSAIEMCGGDAALWHDPEDGLSVVAGGRDGRLVAYDGATGAPRWTVATPTIDAPPTIDPATGRTYVGAGIDSVWVVGVDASGQPLWGSAAVRVFEHVPGVTNPQRAQTAGCLSHDGATFYFQAESEAGDGRLYAIATDTGALKWSYPTNSRGGEESGSSPTVTPNGVLVVGNNGGGSYFALRDMGDHAALIDVLAVDPGGNARASASWSPEGLLYLPLRTTWRIGSYDGEAPTQATANVFTAIDLRVGAHNPLPAPAFQRGVARNHAVLLRWQPVSDPSGEFVHYAIYRAAAPFTTVEGMTPIATVAGVTSSSTTDATAENGIHYWYAITAVGTSGENRSVPSLGPRTPFDETDLQVVTVARTPLFPRYDVEYTYHDVTEPSGFGPYSFSAATGLSGGQDATTQRWPLVGDDVTYTATVRNRGTNPWSGPVGVTWRIDDEVVLTDASLVDLAPGETTSFSLVRAWDDALHEVSVALDITDARAGNNHLGMNTKGVAFLTYIDQTVMETFRENTRDWPEAATDDQVDWLNLQVQRLNAMFASAGTAKRIHYNVLEVLDDTDALPSRPLIDYAVFPLRYRSGEQDARLSGYYNASDDIDYGLLHEMGHQLGLIDIYRLNLEPWQNEVTGVPYRAPEDLMNGCSPFLSPHSAGAMTHWLHAAHGYYGQYLYLIPSEVRLRFLGIDGLPVAGAHVTAYQKAERPGIGEVISNQVKFTGTTDADGVLVLPNVPVDPALVPQTFAGDHLHDNPFGYVAVIATNGLMLFRAERDGFFDHAWLDITEVNNAWFAGQVDAVTLDRRVLIGGSVIEGCAEDDMAEANAAEWVGRASGATMTLSDDTAERQVGAASIRAVTDGGWDTFVRYPGDHLARWDLSATRELHAWFYHRNDHGFQESSPRFFLGSTEGYIEYRPSHDILNETYGAWTRFTVPLAGDATWQRIDHGTVSLADVHYVEIHADTWDFGFTLWIDGVGFDPPLSEAGGLVLAGSGPTALTWAPVPMADGYDVLRGLVSALPGGYGACFADDVEETQASDAERPPDGGSFQYLVRAQSAACSTTGGWGRTSSGEERVSSACP